MNTLDTMEKNLPIIHKKRSALIANIEQFDSQSLSARTANQSELNKEIKKLEQQLQQTIRQLEKERDEYVAKCDKLYKQYDERKNRHWKEVKQSFSNSYRPSARKLNVEEVNQLEKKAAAGGLFVESTHRKLYSAYRDGMLYASSQRANKINNTRETIEKKKAATAAGINSLKKKYAASGSQTSSNLLHQKKLAVEALGDYDDSKNMRTSYQILQLRQDALRSLKIDWSGYRLPTRMPRELLLGSVFIRYPAPQDQKRSFKDFDIPSWVRRDNEQTWEQPVYIDLSGSTLIILSSSTSSSLAESPDKLLARELLCRMLKNLPPKCVSWSILDPMYKGGSLGRLIDITNANSFQLNFRVFPDKSGCNQETDRLRRLPGQIIQAMAGSCGTLYEYNKSHPDSEFPFSWYVDFGFAGKDLGNGADDIRELLTTASTAGTSFVFATTPQGAAALKKLARECCRNVPVCHIDCDKNTLSVNDHPARVFRSPDKPTASQLNGFIEAVKKHYTSDLRKDTAFWPAISRHKRYLPQPFSTKLSLPFALDAKGQLVDLILGGPEGSHAFISGNTGCGKTTLLHTIILSACLQHFPGDLEIWLADYKLDELRQYNYFNPPQVRVVGVSEDPEFSYSLVDRINAELQRRSALFARFPLVNSLDTYRAHAGEPGYVHLPMLLVVVDEFHKMSQAMSDSIEHKTRLENIFREARSKGIRLLLADQGFTTGLGGLTQEARKQIGIRIAMRNDMEEVTGTLAADGYSYSDAMKKAIANLAPGDLIMRRSYNSKGQKVPLYLEQYRSLFTTVDDIKLLVPKLRDQLASRMTLTPPLFVETNVIQRTPWNSQDMLALDEQEPMPEYGIRLYLGKGYTLRPCFAVDIDQASQQHMAIVGGNIRQRWDVLRAVILSCRRNGYKPLVFLAEKHNLPKPLTIQLRELCSQTPGAQLLDTYDMWIDALKRLNRIIEEQEESDDTVCLFVNMEVAEKALQKISEQPVQGASSSDVSFLINHLSQYGGGLTQNPAQTQFVNPLALIREMLESGYRSNIYCVAEVDSASSFNRVFHHAELFRHRIAFDMSKDSLLSYIGRSQDHQKIGQNAIYFGGGSVTYKLLPYLSQNP